MPEQEFNTFPPVYNEDPFQALEHLRQILPKINEHNTAANPVNYAVWYEYVSGKNKELIEFIDQRLSKDQPISTEIAQSLYERFVLMDVPNKLAEANDSLSTTMNTTLDQLSDTESQTNNVMSSLNQSQSDLKNCQSSNDLDAVIEDVIASTESMSTYSKTLKQSLVVAFEEINRLKTELSTVKKLAEKDALTGLLNRGTFDFQLNNLFEQSKDNFALI